MVAPFDTNKELEDWEYPDDPSDDDSFVDEDEPALGPCPECSAQMLEDLEQCPTCGQYVSFSTSPWEGKSVGWTLLGILGVGALIFALLFAV